MSGSLDTNALLRLLLNDIPRQHDAVKVLLTRTKSQMQVSNIAITELVFVLDRYYGFSRIQVTEAITGLMQLKEISCNRIMFEKVLLLFIDHPALSFEDCCLVAYTNLSEAEPLWTFDKKLATQASNARLIGV